jgi:hypothetical protein
MHQSTPTKQPININQKHLKNKTTQLSLANVAYANSCAMNIQVKKGPLLRHGTIHFGIKQN